MYASPFEYLRADSWEDAVARLAEAGEDARPIAGGQSLGPMMMLRMAEPSLLVDVGAAGPRTVARTDGGLRIAALTRHVDLQQSTELREGFPALAEAAGQIGNVRVRHRGTIGGSLAHADPSSEFPCVALAAEATVTTLSESGSRDVRAADLFVSHFTTTLAPGEVITAVTMPWLGPRQGCAFEELARRPGDFAMVEACALAQLGSDGSWESGRVAVGAVAERPLDLTAGLASLQGEEPTPARLRDAAEAAVADVEIGPGGHGSVEYRRRLLAVVVRRALERAIQRATGGDRSG